MARNETERGMELSKSRHNTTTPAKRPSTTHAWDSSACHRNPSLPHILWMSLQNYIRTHPTPSTVTQFVKLPIRRCRSININMRGRVEIEIVATRNNLWNQYSARIDKEVKNNPESVLHGMGMDEWIHIPLSRWWHGGGRPNDVTESSHVRPPPFSGTCMGCSAIIQF